MDECRPYQPPAAPVADPANGEPGQRVLAGRSARLGAAILGGLILMIPWVVCLHDDLAQTVAVAAR